MRQRLAEIGLDEFCRQYPGLQLRPVNNGELKLAGSLAFTASAPGRDEISDRYEVEVTVPPAFPNEPATVRELEGRIPKTFHTNHDGSLCLGSPAQLRLALLRSPTLLNFVNRCLVPFLYGFSYREKYGELPFGELAHGTAGLRQDFAELFGLRNERAASEMVRLGGMKKRVANKRPCPCGSRLRLGRCHHLVVNRVRNELGRRWLREHHREV